MLTTTCQLLNECVLSYNWCYGQVIRAGHTTLLDTAGRLQVYTVRARCHQSYIMLLAHRVLRGPAAARTFSSSRSFSLGALVGRRRYAYGCRTLFLPLTCTHDCKHRCRPCPSIQQQQQQLLGCGSSSAPVQQLCRAATTAAEAVTSSTSGKQTMTLPCQAVHTKQSQQYPW
jgi:hypothetical protein